MMHKLKTHGRIILIGLSTSLYLSGCILFNIDPPLPDTRFFLQEYYNSSSKNIELVVMNDTLEIKTKEIVVYKEFASSVDTVKITILDDWLYSFNSSETIKILVDGQLVKIWKQPLGSFGNNINSPFNYDSWVFEALTPDAKNIVGKITFTITDADLE